MKNYLYILLLLLLSVPAFAVDYAQDANCLGYWRMSGPSSGLEIDSSGHGNTLYANCTDGEILIRSTNVPSGYVGASRQFTGVAYNSNLGRPDSSTGFVTGANAKLSLPAWIYVITAPANGITMAIAGKSSTTAGQRQYRMAVSGTGNSQFSITAYISNDGTAYTSITTTSTTYEDSTWYHVVFTSDDVNMMLYVNSDSAATAVPYTAGIASAKTARFNVGSVYSNGALFIGYIDEVAVFSRALSHAEVQDIYTNGITGNKGASDYPLYTAFSATNGSRPHDSLLYVYLKDSLRALCDTVAAHGDTTWTYTVWGKSVNDSDLFGVVIEPPGYTKTIFFDAGIHGNNGEATTCYGALEFLQWLADSTAPRFPRIRWVVNLVVNPDGVKLSQRKNANGVNLNANFPHIWDTGDTSVSSEVYHGTAPLSEPEAKAIWDALKLYQPVSIYINMHTNSNALFVPSTSLITRAQIPNTFLAENGLEPYIDVRFYEVRGGAAYAVYDSSLASLSFFDEYGICNTTDLVAAQINRQIAQFSVYAQILSVIPKIVSATVAQCSLVTVTWTEDAATDSIRVLRGGVRIGAAVGGTLSYVDTITLYGSYTYKLLAFYDGGQPSDTSDVYALTVSTCASAQTQAPAKRDWRHKWRNKRRGTWR